jgi:hypothetical protein
LNFEAKLVPGESACSEDMKIKVKLLLKSQLRRKSESKGEAAPLKSNWEQGFKVRSKLFLE